MVPCDRPGPATRPSLPRIDSTLGTTRCCSRVGWCTSGATGTLGPSLPVIEPRPLHARVTISPLTFASQPRACTAHSAVRRSHPLPAALARNYAGGARGRLGGGTSTAASPLPPAPATAMSSTPPRSPWFTSGDEPASWNDARRARGHGVMATVGVSGGGAEPTPLASGPARHGPRQRRPPSPRTRARACAAKVASAARRAFKMMMHNPNKLKASGAGGVPTSLYSRVVSIQHLLVLYVPSQLSFLSSKVSNSRRVALACSGQTPLFSVRGVRPSGEWRQGDVVVPTWKNIKFKGQPGRCTQAHSRQGVQKRQATASLDATSSGSCHRPRWLVAFGSQPGCVLLEKHLPQLGNDRRV